MKRIGVLTGGGDCPGLNPVLRAIVRRASVENIEVIGFRYGWKGVIENDQIKLDINSVSGILPKGGTILGTSRTNPCKSEEGIELVKETFKKADMDALIAIGGEDTLGAAAKLFQHGVNVVGVPKTIDNDLNSTDYTFGYHTALEIVTECIDRLHSTAESHNRVIVVEVMGRHAGWLTLEAGIAGGADAIMIPEVKVNIDDVCSAIKARHERGKTFSIVAVAEGAQLNQVDVTQSKELDEFGHVRLGGIGQSVAELIEQKTGFETRVTVLGHIQRGGSPTAYDRILGTRFGVNAVELVLRGEFGKMVSLRGTDIVGVSIQEAVGSLKTVPEKYYKTAQLFCG